MNRPIDTIWISHRGLAQVHIENTQAAFEQACDAGFNYLETDLQSCKDDHIVLCHEPNLSKISDLSANISEMTRQQLSNISLYNGAKLLFLDEFIKIFSQKRWVFDIKPETATQTINTLKLMFKNKDHLVNNTIFLFWGENEQRLFLNDFPQAVCFARSDECYRAGFAMLLALGYGAKIEQDKIYSLHPKFFGLPLLNKKIVQRFHDRGAKVLGYLPESDKDVQRCFSAGVDYILSNHAPPLSS